MDCITLSVGLYVAVLCSGISSSRILGWAVGAKSGRGELVFSNIGPQLLLTISERVL